MADPITLGGLVVWGLGAATGGALGSTTDRGLCALVAGLRDKTAAWRGLPANHHVARAVQIAHAQALEVVIGDFQKSDQGGWAKLPSAERAFYDEMVVECRRLHRFAEKAEEGDLQFDVNVALTGAIDAVLVAPGDGPAGERAAALKAGAEERALGAFRAMLAERLLPEPPGFEAHFRSAAPGKGYVAVFGGFVARQIKTNEAFRNITVVEGLAEIKALGLDALTVMLRLEAAFLPALERIERHIAEGFDAAQQDRDVKHEAILQAIAAKGDIPPENLRPLFEAVGREVPEAQFEEAVRTAVAELLARAEQRPQAFNDPIEIQAAIEAAHARLRQLDPEGAIAILDRAEADERDNIAARNRGRARMRKEKAEILKAVYRYEEALAAFADAAALDPADPWPLFQAGDIWILRGSLDKALSFYEAAEVVADRSILQRELSIAWSKKADLFVKLGNLSEAVSAYENCHVLQKKVAGLDPLDADLQRDLSVSHDRIGDVRVLQGRLDEAANSFQTGLDIRRRLVEEDASNDGLQHDLSISYTKLGDVLVMQGHLENGRKSYEAGLAIRERLALSDPSNVRLHHDLSDSHGDIGNVRVAQGRFEDAIRSYEAKHEIIQRLALSDPLNAGLQRDRSVSNSNIGDVRMSQGRLEDAARLYEESHTILKRLALSDPSSADLQRDLSISFDRIGKVQRSCPSTWWKLRCN
ncbi:tetratricopeptide repeat protein [Jiella pelagia]|uniref:Tetratricopeptide repeat protein n=1 Tax=Jiella pelagia TaxID=2986949 RepID=A0ABY7BY71_9HYPH|nr:tetratricopeptide repeat protein [Jiella pelagia]WAP67468.1 tetratricopeptide repeat protein [Jiella pelagia]